MERPAVSDGRAGHGQAGSAIEGGAVGGTGTVARGRCPGRTAAVDYAAWRTYRWCKPPTSGTETILPEPGGAIGRLSGASLSSER